MRGELETTPLKRLDQIGKAFAGFGIAGDSGAKPVAVEQVEDAEDRDAIAVFVPGVHPPIVREAIPPSRVPQGADRRGVREGLEV